MPASQPSFEIDVEALSRAITPKTSAVIINSPNNPVGAVYTRENLEALAEALEKKGDELGRIIYLISDEPYREITYGKEVPYVPHHLPEHHRVLFVLQIALASRRAHRLYLRCRRDGGRRRGGDDGGGRRASPGLHLRSRFAAARDRPLHRRALRRGEAYAANRKILTDELDRLGYEYVEPDGAFCGLRADDAQAFSDRAKEFELCCSLRQLRRRRLGA